MTFSLAGRCARTGAFGVVAATCDIAVGSRVSYVAAGIGAVITQHRSDPRLGPVGIEALGRGYTAEEVIAELVAETPHSGWRQLAVIDGAGRTASFTGDRVTTVAAEVHGQDCVAIGNCLGDPGVGAAMVAAFEETPADPLGERLMQALEAGLAAGGETSPTLSAVLLVGVDPGMSLIDLRVDHDPAPVAKLRTLWEEYRGWVRDFRLRAIDPDQAAGHADATDGEGVI